MDLILLRHGAPAAEYHRRYIGHTDVEIDENLFEPAKIEPLQNRLYDRIYASDLQRCTATLTRMGMDKFTVDPRLREVRFKPSVEGKNFAEIESTADFDPRVLDSKESWHAFVCEESEGAFRDRVRNFLDELPAHQSILICAHAGSIDMIVSILEPERPTAPLGYLDHIVLSPPKVSSSLLG